MVFMGEIYAPIPLRLDVRAHRCSEVVLVKRKREIIDL
jgi:hypothetical protein